jgi:hypothetical protein
MPQDSTLLHAAADRAAASPAAWQGLDQAAGLGPDTPVMTAAGERPAGDLAPGDRILTRAGMRRLTAVVRHPAGAAAIRVSASALGHDRPGQDVILAPGQPVHLRDWRAAALYGAAAATVPVARLADGDYIRATAPGGQPMVTLHFDAPAVIYAGGLELACC